ncbi:MAG: multidrug effflux MFS transporter [Candidatus Puniceispirillaceae bacterium]|jgi:DHA1 family bicyclomycin/chloramphenicol resistance-like MFS transporter
MTSSTLSRPGASYLAIMALLTSIGALTTDIMLPALGVIGRDLDVGNINNTTLIVTAFFLGMAIGQLVVGPLADTYGRKPVVMWGYALFILGCLLSMVAESWTLMVVARVCQGLAAAAPRVIAVAIVRDEYKGRVMARIMSIIMAVFILTPIMAPLLGQGLIYIGGWRATFAGLIIVALPTAWWFHLSIAETLPPARRRPFTFRAIGDGVIQICRSRVTVVYMLAMGIISGPFIGYLGSARQIFQDVYGVGDMFVVYFAAGSISAGAAALVNARLVMRHGMRRLTAIAITAQTAVSAALWGWMALGGVPDFMIFMGWQIACVFCVGMMFGNMQALAMEPLGHVAGLGAAIFGAGSTFVALPLSWMVSGYFDGTIIPLIRGFAIMGIVTLIMVLVAGRR